MKVYGDVDVDDDVDDDVTEIGTPVKDELISAPSRCVDGRNKLHQVDEVTQEEVGGTWNRSEKMYMFFSCMSRPIGIFNWSCLFRCCYVACVVGK